jgi:hypothetical protein
MRSLAIGLGLGLLIATGAGCALPALPDLPFLAKDIPAQDLQLAAGSVISLQQISLNPLETLNKQPERVVTVTDWQVSDHVTVQWQETWQRETADSIAARATADRATPVGQEANVPEPIYETITQQGGLVSDALDDGDRMLLPSAWPESDSDLSGKGNSLLWLSKAQYLELSTTRHTQVTLGSVDAGLQIAAETADKVKNFIAQFTGTQTTAITDQDVTDIQAAADWGSYVVSWQGQKVSVPTIEAENSFAHYTILANPDNPLILKVDLKPWAYGTEALGILSDDLKISGYQVKTITTP